MTDKPEKKKGRPPRETEPDKTYHFRLPDDLISDLDVIADEESKRTGYRLDRVNIVRRALTDFIQRYNQEREQ